MSQMLQDQVAIITGAGRSIGREYALRFCQEGAKLLLPDINLERVEGVAKEIRAKGGEAAAIQVDISDEGATKMMAERVIQLYGRVDVLLNNAGLVSVIRPWDKLSVDEWDHVFDINVRGTWLCCKAIVPLMVKQSKGKIVNISSNVLGIPGGELQMHYSCSKAAVYTMTQCLARALGASGINVNAIAPGLTPTEATANIPDQVFNQVVASQCIPRREKPMDLVGTAVFLASRDSDFITGQLIVVDGGFWLK
jgi:3-oxoacyl-[acyl-carrier protein] reductase